MIRKDKDISCGYVRAPKVHRRGDDNAAAPSRGIPVRTLDNHAPLSDKEKYDTYAMLSKMAYESDDPVTALEKHSKESDDLVAKRFRVDTHLSDKDHVTFVDSTTGKAVVSFRGTDVTNTSDLFADAAIFFGVQDHTSRFKRAVKVTDAAVAKYGKGNVDVTGHSLGGSQALYATKVTGVPSYAYNPGRSLDKFGLDAIAPVASAALDLVDKRARKNTKRAGKQKGSVTKKKSNAYVTGLDPISLAMALHPSEANVHYVPPNQGLDTHGIDNFL